MQLEYKMIPFHQAKMLGDGQDSNGSIAGYASQFGHVDSYGDTIPVGAYLKYLPEFLKAGFIGWNHEWSVMIGTPSAAHEDSTGLFLSADFHSTPAAQEARTIATERLARGLSMGLSIGYQAHSLSYQDSPTPGGDPIRVLDQIELFEVSLVAAPADKYAQVIAAKARDLSAIPTDRFADQGERVLLDLRSYLSRAAEIHGLREKSGRVLSEANRQRLSSLLDQLGALDGVRSEIEELLAVTESPKAQAEILPDLSLLLLDVERTLARYSELPA